MDDKLAGEAAKLATQAGELAGNLRGMDHLSASLHYMKMNVHHNKLPISVIDRVMDKNGRLNEETLKAIDEQISEFINF